MTDVDVAAARAHHGHHASRHHLRGARRRARVGSGRRVVVLPRRGRPARRTSRCSARSLPLRRLRARSGPATASSPARSSSKTCWTSRCTAADVVEALGLDEAAPHRPLDGRDDRGRDGGRGAGPAYGRLVLIAPLGLWLDDHPITDIYSLLPFEFPPLLFHDPAAGTALMAGGARLQRHRGDQDVPHRQQPPARHRRQDPVPDPRPRGWRSGSTASPTRPCSCGATTTDTCRRRTPRLAAPRSTEPELETIPEAGHMAPYEQPGDVAGVIARFFGV